MRLAIRCSFAAVAIPLAVSTSLATGSIFSAKGFGIMEEVSSSRAVGMGNTGVALEDSNTINFANPALLSAVLLTRIVVGGYISRQWMRDPHASDKDDWAQVEYFGLALPIKKNWGLGFFLTPYSRVEFDYAWNGTLASSLPNVNPVPYLETYQSTGGLTRAALNLAWAPTSNVRLGLGGNLIWGDVQEYRTSIINAAGYSSVQYTNSKRYNSFGGTLGLLLKPSPDLVIGAAFDPEVPLRLEGTYSYTSSDSAIALRQDFRLAARYRLGTTYHLSPRWLLAGQVVYGAWSNAKELPTGTSYRDSYDLGMGAEWTPGSWDADGLFKRMQYRFGLRRETTYMLSEGKGVDNYVASAGFSYPFHQGMNRFDISFEYGRRGELSANGGEENTFKVRLGLNLGESWFQRTKPPWAD